jgi:hypothetical protein
VKRRATSSELHSNAGPIAPHDNFWMQHDNCSFATSPKHF